MVHIPLLPGKLIHQGALAVPLPPALSTHHHCSHSLVMVPALMSADYTFIHVNKHRAHSSLPTGYPSKSVANEIPSSTS